MHPTAEGRRFYTFFCPKGHDKRKVGVTNKGRCRECHNAYNRGYNKNVRNNISHLHDVGSGPIPGLRKVREKLGYSSYAFGRRVGISSSMILRIEKGSRDAGRINRAKILDFVQSELARRRERVARLRNGYL